MPVRGHRPRRRLAVGSLGGRGDRRRRDRCPVSFYLVYRKYGTCEHPDLNLALKLRAHNLDAIVALVALPVFLLAGLPLAGWFWATALWALNRYRRR